MNSSNKNDDAYDDTRDDARGLIAHLKNILETLSAIEKKSTWQGLYPERPKKLLCKLF